MKCFKRLVMVAGAVLLTLGGWCVWECRDLPGAADIRSQIFAHYSPKERSTWVPLWAISSKLQVAVVDWEDPRFYFHHGFEPASIWEAFQDDLRAGAYRRGGSTITQQVAKNLFLNPEKSLGRKLREAVLARRLERALSKEEILEVYLNIAEWGDGIRGAEAASRFYFSKSAEELTWAEAALLAGILPNPHQLNPFRTPNEARRRRQVVLMMLAEDEEMTYEDLRQAVVAPCCANPNPEGVRGDGTPPAPQQGL